MKTMMQKILDHQMNLGDLYKLQSARFWFLEAIKRYRRILCRYAGPQIATPIYECKINDPKISKQDQEILRQCLLEAMNNVE